MKKRLFLLLILSFIGVNLRPGFLAADQIIELKQPNFHAVETIIPQSKPKTTPVVQSVQKTSVSTPKAVTVKSPKPTSTPVTPKLANYTVSYYIGSVDEYTKTAYNLSYRGIYRFRKMIYGHNSANLLGSLSNRYVGEKFTITEGGITKTYQVMVKNIYRKTANGYLNGDSKLMNNIANLALGYDVALLTCAGTSYGNGDASHRLVILANQI